MTAYYCQVQTSPTTYTAFIRQGKKWESGKVLASQKFHTERPCQDDHQVMVEWAFNLAAVRGWTLVDAA